MAEQTQDAVRRTKSVYLGVRQTEESRARLEGFAKRKGMSLTDAIEYAIEVAMKVDEHEQTILRRKLAEEAHNEAIGEAVRDIPLKPNRPRRQPAG